MKTKSDILSVLSTLRDYLQESHQDELDNHHHGDDSDCSYCKALEKADAILASSSSPDDGNDAPAHHMRDAVPLCTFVVNPKVIPADVDWQKLEEVILTAAGVTRESTPFLTGRMGRVYDSECVFFTLRENFEEFDWLKIYAALIDARMLVRVDQDAEEGELARWSSDGVLMTQDSLAPHAVDGTIDREETYQEIVSCIGDAIEGRYESIHTEDRESINAILDSKDVLATLAQEYPHCEWFEAYRFMIERDLIHPVPAQG